MNHNTNDSCTTTDKKAFMSDSRWNVRVLVHSITILLDECRHLPIKNNNSELIDCIGWQFTNNRNWYRINTWKYKKNSAQYYVVVDSLLRDYRKVPSIFRLYSFMSVIDFYTTKIDVIITDVTSQRWYRSVTAWVGTVNQVCTAFCLYVCFLK